MRVCPCRRGRTAALSTCRESTCRAPVAGAIAKAITGAYLSSGGNAFSTRTASMIVQQHFPPAPSTVGLESGPLYGVQFSQLPCSDLAARFNGNVGSDGFVGPKRSPLGLSADAGGFPLYKNGVVVGGVGVMADGVYGFDPDVQNVDKEDEEIIALPRRTVSLLPIPFAPIRSVSTAPCFVFRTQCRETLRVTLAPRLRSPRSTGLQAR
jgi:hypothetical protein